MATSKTTQPRAGTKTAAPKEATNATVKKTRPAGQSAGQRTTTGARVTPREGDRAPSFSLASDAGGTVALADFKGKTLVLYFYPKDNTPGCTREAQAFSSIASKLAKKNAAVVGVSKDSIKSHMSFRDKYALKLPLLSDPDLSVHTAYGAFGEKTLYGKKMMGTIRSTFVIDPKGTIVRAFPNVKVDGHAEAVLEVVESIAADAK